MVRIRIGESWKQNPAYVTALQALAEGRARGFSPKEIVDVLGIEVDGVDLAQGAAEAAVFDVMAHLLRAARELAAGPGERRIHLHGAPVELLLERSDSDLRLTLLATDGSAPPVSVLLDPRRFFAAARRATHLFVDDLQAIHPRLGEMRVVRELLREANRASRRQRPVVRRARQRTMVEAPLGRLSLVIQGPPPRLAVLGPEGQTCWMETVEPGEALLRLARTVQRGMSSSPEEGERLPSGLVVDPSRQVIGFGRYDVPFEQVARALLTLAPLVAPILPAGLRSAVDAAVQALAELPPDGPTTLSFGDSPGGASRRNEAGSLAAPGPRNRSRAVRAPGLPSAGLRRLFLRASWRADAPGRSPRLIRCGSSLIVSAGGRVDLRSITGELKWSTPLHDARVVTMGGQPQVAGRDTQGSLVLLDPRTGARVSRAALTLGRLRDACPVADGTLAVHDDTRLALVSPDGQVAWSLDGGDGGFRIAAAGKGLVLADERGDLRGLDAGGRVEWRCRTGLDPLVSLVVDRTNRAVIAAGLDTNGHAMLVSTSLADGAVRWSVVLDGVRPAGLTLAGSRVLLGYESLAGSLLAAVSANTGLVSWSTRPPGDGTALPAVMPGTNRILVARSGGGLCAYSPAGELQFHAPAADPEPSLSPVRPRPLALGAGLAVSTGALLHVYEAASGRLLTSLEPYDLAPEAVLLLDGPVVVCAGRDGSLVEAWSARGHLGVAPSLPPENVV